MTLAQLASEIRAARRRLTAELDPWRKLPPVHSRQTARNVLSLLLEFETRWQAKQERLAREHREELYGDPRRRRDWRRTA